MLVGDVVPGSPADKAGLKQGDVITSVRRREGPRPLVVPAQGRHQRGRQAVRAGLPPRGQGADHLDRPGPGREGRLRHRGEGRQPRIGTEKAEPAKTVDQRLRPGSPAADRRAGQAARLARRPQGRRWSPPSRTAAPPQAAGIQEGDVITKVVRDQQAPAAHQRQGFPGPRREGRRAGALRPDGKVGRFVVLSKNAEVTASPSARRRPTGRRRIAERSETKRGGPDKSGPPLFL